MIENASISYLIAVLRLGQAGTGPERTRCGDEECLLGGYYLVCKVTRSVIIEARSVNPHSPALRPFPGSGRLPNASVLISVLDRIPQAYLYQCHVRAALEAGATSISIIVNSSPCVTTPVTDLAEGTPAQGLRRRTLLELQGFASRLTFHDSVAKFSPPALASGGFVGGGDDGSIVCLCKASAQTPTTDDIFALQSRSSASCKAQHLCR